MRQGALPAVRTVGYPGGITHWIWTKDRPSIEELETNTRDQAMLMASGGYDLIMLEMLSHITACLPVLIEPKQVDCQSGRIIIRAKPMDGRMCLLGGEPLEDALTALKEKDVPLISIMHTGVDHIDACLEILKTHWPGAVGIYAHVCQFCEDNTTAIFDDMISPQTMPRHPNAGWIKAYN